jgi:hypothetical protein
MIKYIRVFKNGRKRSCLSAQFSDLGELPPECLGTITNGTTRWASFSRRGLSCEGGQLRTAFAGRHHLLKHAFKLRYLFGQPQVLRGLLLAALA